MTEITTEEIEAACACNFWDFGNSVLYRLCAENPKHIDPTIVVAKVWLIGRSYAAAIERTRNRPDVDSDIYLERVAPIVTNPEIDRWMKTAASLDLKMEDAGELVQIHKKLNDLFLQVSNQNKRSLASKYLHFHLPEKFFIYDSRAVRGIAKLSAHTGNPGIQQMNADNEYRRFFAKCLALRDNIAAEHKMVLTPRQIDNLLLQMSSTTL